MPPISWDRSCRKATPKLALQNVVSPFVGTRFCRDTLGLGLGAPHAGPSLGSHHLLQGTQKNFDSLAREGLQLRGLMVKMPHTATTYIYIYIYIYICISLSLSLSIYLSIHLSAAAASTRFKSVIIMTIRIIMIVVVVTVSATINTVSLIVCTLPPAVARAGAS